MEEAAWALKHSDGSPRYKERYVDAARAYYARVRPHGALTIYDEQKIANDLAALIPGAVVKVAGDYIDNSQINLRPNPNELLVAREAIESAILSAIRRAMKEGLDGASRAWLAEKVRADRELIASTLESLQLSGMVEIGNRDDGVIVYRINEIG